MNEDEDDISYVALGHHYDEISDVFRIAKWCCLGFVVIVIIICIAI